MATIAGRQPEIDSGRFEVTGRPIARSAPLIVSAQQIIPRRRDRTRPSNERCDLEGVRQHSARGSMGSGSPSRSVRSANRRSNFGSIARSRSATMSDVGFAFHATQSFSRASKESVRRIVHSASNPPVSNDTPSVRRWRNGDPSILWLGGPAYNGRGGQSSSRLASDGWVAKRPCRALSRLDD
jgi:hypothetical protein